jgi:hypothetical protein
VQRARTTNSDLAAPFAGMTTRHTSTVTLSESTLDPRLVLGAVITFARHPCTARNVRDYTERMTVLCCPEYTGHRHDRTQDNDRLQNDCRPLSFRSESIERFDRYRQTEYR